MPQRLSILDISTLEELAGVLKTLSSSHLTKLRILYPSSPIYQLLDKYPGITYREKAYVAVNGKTVCKICGSSTSFNGVSKGFAIYCSRQCMNSDKQLATNNLNKRRETMQQRYGVTATFLSTELVAKGKATSTTRYGIPFAQSTNSAKIKRATTNVQRYGGVSPVASKSVTDKISASKRKSSIASHIKEAANRGYTLLDAWEAPDQIVKWCCPENHIFEHQLSTTQRGPLCRVCFPVIKGTSQYEMEIADWLRGLGQKVTTNVRIQREGGYDEIDILLPELSMGIEFNGLYWHSEQAGKGVDWHLEKLHRIQAVGITLLQIFEHEWRLKRPIVESVIRSKLGITSNRLHARHLRVAPLDNKAAMDWFSRTHLSGAARIHYAFALYQGSTPMMVAGWAKARYGNRGQMELIRLSTELDTTVVGGLGRLTKAAVRQWPNTILVSFCDRRWGTGNGYLASGWSKSGVTRPAPWYFSSKGLMVEHRSRWQKKKLQQLLPGVDGTAEQLASKLGLQWFWDCGNFKFEVKT
ncbi:MAG: hypothetical protein DDT31_00037 [Syntrophomonadaceae bacterium]|nr:hypothetical protein [Bacillota bacterium]